MIEVWQALEAPRRREILSVLRRGETSAGEIHRALGELTFGAVSQHLGILEGAGLVSVRREGRSRLYAARRQGLEPVRAWLATMWDDALAKLRTHAEAEAARAGAPGREARRRHEGGPGGRAAVGAGRKPVERRKR